METVPQLAQEYELKGWVRATEIPDTKALADELLRLHAENNELREKLTTQAEEIKKTDSNKSNSEKEFSEILKILMTKMINIKSLKEDTGSFSNSPDEVSLIVLVHHNTSFKFYTFAIIWHGNEEGVCS